MNKIISVFLIIFFLSFSSAIIISEVEINPSGADPGNEWIEFYSENEINFSEYLIKNNDGDEIILTGTFSGYFVYELNKQWLDNSDEKVFLYKGEELIDETDLLDDSKNNNLAFSYCGDSWEFIESTKGQENSCQEPEPDPLQNPPTQENEENSSEEEEQEVEEQTPLQEPPPKNEKKEIQTINLNSQVIKTEDSEENNKKNNAIFYIITFCVILVLLYLIKKPKQKNEFQ